MVSPIRRWVREFGGVLASGGFTLLVFAGGPICGLLWWVSGAADLAEMIAPPMDDGPAARVSWADVPAISLDEQEGEAGEDEQSTGDDGVAEVSGDEGTDEGPSPAVTPVAAVAPRGTRVVADARMARGIRAPAAGNGDGEGVHRARKGRKVCPTSHPDVHQDGDERWEVNRNLVEYYTASIKRFNSLGWSGPYENDDFKGWKIGGFGCESPLYHAGLRRGDIVLSVNDKPTRNWLQVFGAYAKLKFKKEFEIVVVRKGQRKTFNYTLVNGGQPHV